MRQDGSLVEQLRQFWDADSATYDRDAVHHPTAPLERSAWRGALESLLPPAPARVLDVGAGTGFLSLMLAELGYRVTAVDLSPGMLGVLDSKAEKADLEIDTVQADAASVPPGPFDAIVSRHLLWTLLEPLPALRAWHNASPQGRLVLLETLWWDSGTLLGSLRPLALQGLHRLRRTRPAHHASYSPELRAALPLGHAVRPESLIQLVTDAGWTSPRLYKLAAVDWAASRSLAWPERTVGVPPRFALVAGAR